MAIPIPDAGTEARRLLSSPLVHLFPARIHEAIEMFFFFSNRTGCLGSIAISLAVSALLFFAIRGCGAGP